MSERFDFLGVKFSAINPELALEELLRYDYDCPGYLSFPDSSVVAMAQNDPALVNILNNAVLTLPDGKPSQIVARSKGYRQVKTVSGYWLCKQLLATDKRHYFLGSTPEKLEMIRKNIEKEFPEAQVLGYASPAFYPVSYFEAGNLLQEELLEINRLQPDLIWVGLSSPKQDYLIRSHVKKLEHGVLLGVGGVFDYLSGDIDKSPEWIKKIGLRWLWRLLREPKRLGPKYWSTFRIFFKVVVLKQTGEKK